MFKNFKKKFYMFLKILNFDKVKENIEITKSFIYKIKASINTLRLLIVFYR